MNENKNIDQRTFNKVLKSSTEFASEDNDNSSRKDDRRGKKNALDTASASTTHIQTDVVHTSGVKNSRYCRFKGACIVRSLVLKQ
jgi:hypothetical protein